MKKLENIFQKLVSEQKKVEMDPEVYLLLKTFSENLWSDRNKKYKGKTLIGEIPFKTFAGVNGLVKIYVNLRLKYIGFLDTKPGYSRDPMDFEMVLNPKYYESKKNLFLTMYHEMLHAMDPRQSHEMNIKSQTKYNPEKDEMYWAHPTEFLTIPNEFLEGLNLEIEERLNNLRVKENKKYLSKSLNNILNHFKSGEPLSKLSMDILYNLNSPRMENKISDTISKMSYQYPSIADFKKTMKDEPYYLVYINLVKEYGPEIWPRFLTMLYKDIQNLQKIIKDF